MGSIPVDQIDELGALVTAPDIVLSNAQKDQLLIEALPGARIERFAGSTVARLDNQVILRKQVTHLGHPWPGFKKRIQIPPGWLHVHREATAAGLRTRFVGIYHHGQVTIFVDFDPRTYVQRRANNSAAHVSTNDLHQAQVLGTFSRTDRGGNVLTSVRADNFEDYLRCGTEREDPRWEVFRSFNEELFSDGFIDALTAVQAMRAARWPDAFQAEWPGFYVEHRLDSFLRTRGHDDLIAYQKVKTPGMYDYDLVFRQSGTIEFYGDLKASDVAQRESPGNDAEDFARCLGEFGRFWYVIYEHETVHARDHGDVATVRWNEWRRSMGHRQRGEFDPLSYARRFKESVRFVRMSILEVNEANRHVVLGDFAQGRQPSGAARALKVMIKKRNIDNFLIHTDRASEAGP